jgi:hypothetical protein
MEKKRIAVTCALTALMILTAAIYFAEGLEESSELGSAKEANVISSAQVDSSGSNNVNDIANTVEVDSSSALVETVFFMAVGAAYVGVGGWMLIGLSKDKSPNHSSIGTTLPYFVAMVGSAALIVLYVVSRTVALPIVGLQDDVGIVDILSKILQAAIIGVGGYLLLEMRKEKVWTGMVR